LVNLPCCELVVDFMLYKSKLKSSLITLSYTDNFENIESQKKDFVAVVDHHKNFPLFMNNKIEIRTGEKTVYVYIFLCKERETKSIFSLIAW